MRILDLFCGAGGASMGLFRAGFSVVGVDIEPQPNYPFEFIQADALEIPLKGYHAYWASPPCQGYSWATKRHRNKGRIYPDLIEPIRNRLLKTKRPYIIENVVGSPLLEPTIFLEGPMFNLGVIRRRVFETNFSISQPKKRKRNGTVKKGDYVTVAGYGSDGSGRLEDWRTGMKIHWMNKKEIRQAVPPAYSEYIGKILLQHLKK